MSQKDFDVVHHMCTTEILRVSAYIVVACQLRNFHLEQHTHVPTMEFTYCLSVLMNYGVLTAGSEDMPSTKRPHVENVIELTSKNPVMELNEHYPGLVYQFSGDIGLPCSPLFEAKVIIRGWEFKGQGGTKRNAKMEVAKQALHYLHNLQVIDAVETQHAQPNQMLADRIALPAEEKFTELSAGIQNAESLKKVLAAIIMMRGSQGRDRNG